MVISRQFSEFVLKHPVAQTLREWTKDMEIPDESFFSTLARITNITQDGKSGNFTVLQNHINELKLNEGLCPRHCDSFI